MDGDLHVTVVVTRDDATGIPVSYVRDRVAFHDDQQAADYAARLAAWVADRPSPEPIGPWFPWPTVSPEPFDAARLEQILSVDRWPA